VTDAGLREELLAQLHAGLTPSPDKPDETVESTLHALWHTAAGAPCSAARASTPLTALNAVSQQQLRELVSRRLAGEPLAYLTGRQQFMGIEFHTAPGALIPRRETEIVGKDALALLHAMLAGHPHPNVLDLCTGSGNLAIALAHHVPAARIWAADLEQPALEVAAANAKLHGLADRIRFLQGDLLDALGGDSARSFDLIVCNPPYLTSKHAQSMPKEIGADEPVAAFDGGPFGVSITMRLVREAPGYLAPGGWLCFELGAGQGAILEKRLRDNPAYVEVHSSSDTHGVVRALRARVE